MTRQRFFSAVPYIILAVALIVAIFLRFYKLGQVPPALNGDEAIIGSGALHILEDGPVLYIEGQGGAGILSSYLTAPFFMLLEAGKMALRFQASLFGALTVILIFLAARTLFGSEDRKRAGWIAAVAALALAVNYGHVTISRIAFPMVHTPVFQLPAILFFWRGCQKKGRVNFLLGGVLLGVLSYGYLAGLITPAIFMAFGVTGFITLTFTGGDDDVAGNRYSFAGAQYFIIAFMVLILPLLLFYATNLDKGLSGRMSEASFLNSTLNQGDPWGALWRGIRGNFSAFGLAPIAWILQQNWHAFSNAPFVLLIFLGVIIVIRRIKQPPYQFLLIWWALTIVPAALAPDQIPHASRAIGVYPPISILATLPLVEAGFFSAAALSRLRVETYTVWPAIKLLAGVAFLAWAIVSIGRITWQRFDHYFNIWPYTNDALAAFDAYADDLVRDMALLATPQSVFLLPRNTSAGSISPNGSVNFFYRLTNNPAPHYWVPDDEDALPTALTRAAQQATIVRVVRWKVSKHTGADPKALFKYYLEKYGDLTQVQQYPDYNIETYTLPQPGVNFQTAESLLPVEADFGGQVALKGYAFGSAAPGNPQSKRVPSGDSVWARLRWQKLADHPEDLKVSLIVKDALGHRAVAVDKYLQNNWLHQRSTQWPAGSVEDTYFIFNLPSNLMPGEYALWALVYGEESQPPLAILPGATREFPLGALHLLPPVRVPALPALPAGAPVETLAGDLQFYVASLVMSDNLRPGDYITLDVLWYTPISPHTDYTFQLALRGKGGEVIPLLAANLIGGDAYPAHRWRAGETLRQHYLAMIPPGTSGKFILTGIVTSQDDGPLQWEIESVAAHDWKHTFDLAVEAAPLGARYGDILLAGYNLDWKPAVAGTPGQVSVTLYWQADAPPKKTYTAFVHLLNETGELVAQVDRPPTGGEKPMTGWLPGEIIADTLTLDLPADTAPELLRVAVGLYDPDTFQRLPVLWEGKSNNKVMLY